MNPRTTNVSKVTFFAAYICLLLLINICPAQISGGLDATDLKAQFASESQDDASLGLNHIAYESPINENEYIIGPGDELQVYVGKSFNIKINPESFFIFPGEPPILLDKLTLADAKSKIKEALGLHFKKDLINVSLRQVKLIKVAVLGEVKKQGLYTVLANTRLSELIVKAEGFAKTARLPMVQIIHRDSAVKIYDLGEYYRTGNLDHNPYVIMGERVVVPRIDATKPKIELLLDNSSYFYELARQKRLGEIVTEMSGFARSVDLREGRLKSGMVLTGIDLLEYIPQNGDIIDLVGNRMKIFVEGQIERPNGYDFRPGSSARDYIAQAGLSVASQSTGKVLVVRANGQRIRLDISSTDIHPGDHLNVEMTRYAHFKDYLVTFSSVATVILATYSLIQISKSF